MECYEVHKIQLLFGVLIFWIYILACLGSGSWIFLEPQPPSSSTIAGGGGGHLQGRKYL